MLATKLKGHITAQHQLQVDLPTDLPPGAVEVIVLHSTLTPTLKRRSKRKAAHPAFGIWADRQDIADSASFAAQLRAAIETRRDRHG
jgi:hypothetical protein